MKKFGKVFALLGALIVLSSQAYSKGNDKKVLKIGATPEPHAAILELVKADLKKQGITLKIIEFTDYVVPNEAVESGEIDGNYFQHKPYMDSFNTERGYHLVSVVGVHVEPLAVYSHKIKKLADLKNGATIAIPNDPTNEGRSLLLLQAAGFIKLDNESNLQAVPSDIVENKKNLKFKEIEAASLPRVLDDVDAAVINGNYALPAGLTSARDGLLVEGKDSPYVNILTVKDGMQNDPRVQALAKALQSQKVKDYILKNYPDGDVVAVF